MEQKLMTAKGYKDLLDKINYFQSVERRKAREEVNASLEGNLSENSEFQHAKTFESQIESRILELERAACNVKVVDLSLKQYEDKIEFGSSVMIKNIDTNLKRTFQIVGEYEADVKDGRISYTSPMGRALLGLEEGEEFTVKTPGGDRYWEVVSIVK